MTGYDFMPLVSARSAIRGLKGLGCCGGDEGGAPDLSSAAGGCGILLATRADSSCLRVRAELISCAARAARKASTRGRDGIG